MEVDMMEIDDKSGVQPKIETLDYTIIELPTKSLTDVENTNEIEIIPSKELESPIRLPGSTQPKNVSKKSNGKKKRSGLQEEIICKNDEPLLSFYARRKIISLLQNTYPVGNPDDKNGLTIKLNYSTSQSDKIVKYIECQAKHGEKNAEQENNDESFVRITEWIKFLHDKHMNDISGNELPLLFKLIANMEEHPKPVEIGGIDLQELYTFISNIMLGYPAKNPTGATGQFLNETYKSIISEMSSISRDTQLLDEHLKKSDLIAVPDTVDNFNLEELRLMLCNSSTNPFNFPFEFLNLNHFENIFGNSGSI